MADNYLERKMEDYRSGKSATTKSHRASSTTKPGTINVKFPPRRVFVTGGASGIGRAIVEAFRKADCRVAFCDIDAKAGAATAQATGAQFHPVDVRDVDALEACLNRLFNTWGDIDVIVNNVGVSNFTPLIESTVSDFENILNTNLRPVFITARQLALHRTNQGGTPAYGRIINLCSTRHLQSEAGSEGYAASKGAIASLTHSLMMSLAPLGITVNCISPGWIENYNYNNLSESDHLQHPSQRVGRPEDIARMCIFLAMPENDFINGENIVIDGGMTRKMIYVD
ncbi:MAG: SDR family oxidoreductase [Muribaculaceae bacterium]|nr:SDR family oxidoreductase [Muribaculaceae bacterium]